MPSKNNFKALIGPQIIHPHPADYKMKKLLLDVKNEVSENYDTENEKYYIDVVIDQVFPKMLKKALLDNRVFITIGQISVMENMSGELRDKTKEVKWHRVQYDISKRLESFGILNNIDSEGIQMYTTDVMKSLEDFEKYVSFMEHHKNNKGGQQTNGGPPLLWNLTPYQLRELRHIVQHARTGTGVP